MLTGSSAIFNVIWGSWVLVQALPSLSIQMAELATAAGAQAASGEVWRVVGTGWGPHWERQSKLSPAAPLLLTPVSLNRWGSCWGDRRSVDPRMGTSIGKAFSFFAIGWGRARGMWEKELTFTVCLL